MAQQGPWQEVVAQREALRSSLAGLLPMASPESLHALALAARFRTVAPGESIYRQGEPVQLTLIQDGLAISQRTTDDGHLLMAEVGGAGMLFGYSAIADTPSGVAIIAMTTCAVVQWQGRDLRPIFERDAHLAVFAASSLAASLHLMIEKIDGFLHQDARRRVVRVLERYRDLIFADQPVLHRGHLPGLVGTTREMTRRVLRQLEREGTLARVGQNGLRLLRPERLAGAERPGSQDTNHVALQPTRARAS
jgi:CRP-like cAMP-binding protein